MRKWAGTGRKRSAWCGKGDEVRNARTGGSFCDALASSRPTLRRCTSLCAVTWLGRLEQARGAPWRMPRGPLVFEDPTLLEPPQPEGLPAKRRRARRLLRVERVVFLFGRHHESPTRAQAFTVCWFSTTRTALCSLGRGQGPIRRFVRRLVFFSGVMCRAPALRLPMVLWCCGFQAPGGRPRPFSVVHSVAFSAEQQSGFSRSGLAQTQVELLEIGA